MNENLLADEWLAQARYDLDTAQYLYNGGRYIYTVFMCHLSLEKALKGIYVLTRKKLPPKTHSLDYFVQECYIRSRMPAGMLKFITELDRWCVPVRYPEKLAEIQKIFSKQRTGEILENTVRALQWIDSHK